MKNKTYNWIWKWHFIGGLVSFPIIFILSFTGIIYLFKGQYEAPVYKSVKTVAEGKERISYQHQWETAKREWNKKPDAMVIPGSTESATEFTSGRFSNKASLFIDPYTGEVTGDIVVKKTDMFKVRKLHGELLMGSFGTKIVELAGSWMVVLILTGLYLFWPRKLRDWRQLFIIRTNGPKSVFYRDVHRVSGFWFSAVLLLILAGGLPWTDVFGDGFRWVQKQTNTGYPAAWQGRCMPSTVQGDPVTLDEIVEKAQALGLPGELTIKLPSSEKGVFSVHNTYHKDHTQQVAVHFDQYSGKQIAALEWQDVGILMRGRMWAMSFHQGEFGWWNWVLVLIAALALLVLSAAAITSYFLRKKPGSWGVPRNSTYKVGYGFYVLVILSGILLPLFGASVVLIWAYERINKLLINRIQRNQLTTN